MSLCGMSEDESQFAQVIDKPLLWAPFVYQLPVLCREHIALFIKALVQDGAHQFPCATVQPRFFDFFCVEIRLTEPS